MLVPVTVYLLWKSSYRKKLGKENANELENKYYKNKNGNKNTLSLWAARQAEGRKTW